MCVCDLTTHGTALAMAVVIGAVVILPVKLTSDFFIARWVKHSLPLSIYIYIHVYMFICIHWFTLYNYMYTGLHYVITYILLYRYVLFMKKAKFLYEVYFYKSKIYTSKYIFIK